MRYYFKYIVKARNYHGKICFVTMTADNPKHLIKRFKTKYPKREIIEISPCDD